MKCSICNEKIEGFGNNAQPINDGICCDDCYNIVILARLNVNITERVKEMSNEHK